MTLRVATSSLPPPPPHSTRSVKSHVGVAPLAVAVLVFFWCCSLHVYLKKGLVAEYEKLGAYQKAFDTKQRVIVTAEQRLSKVVSDFYSELQDKLELSETLFQKSTGRQQRSKSVASEALHNARWLARRSAEVTPVDKTLQRMEHDTAALLSASGLLTVPARFDVATNRMHDLRRNYFAPKIRELQDREDRMLFNYI